MTDIFGAIADPIRRQILDALGGKAALTVSELVALTGETQPTVSKHLKTLRDAELVEVTVEGQKRLYSVNSQALSPVASWLAKFDTENSLLEERLGDAGAQLGAWLSAGSSWVGSKIAEQVDIDTDPKTLGRELGRMLADTKHQAELAAREAEKSARQAAAEARQSVNQVVEDIKTRVAKPKSDGEDLS